MLQKSPRAALGDEDWKDNMFVLPVNHISCSVPFYNQ